MRARVQPLAPADLSHVTGGGPVLDATMKWGGRLGMGAAAATSAVNGVSDGVQDYRQNQSVGHAILSGAKTFAKEIAVPAATTAASYAGLYNPYTLGAAALAYAMKPTPAY